MAQTTPIQNVYLHHSGSPHMKCCTCTGGSDSSLPGCEWHSVDHMDCVQCPAQMWGRGESRRLLRRVWRSQGKSQSMSSATRESMTLA